MGAIYQKYGHLTQYQLALSEEIYLYIIISLVITFFNVTLFQHSPSLVDSFRSNKRLFWTKTDVCGLGSFWTYCDSNILLKIQTSNSKPIGNEWKGLFIYNHKSNLHFFQCETILTLSNGIWVPFAFYFILVVLRAQFLTMLFKFFFQAYLSLPDGMATAAGLIAMMTDHYNILVRLNLNLSRTVIHVFSGKFFFTLEVSSCMFN